MPHHTQPENRRKKNQALYDLKQVNQTVWHEMSSRTNTASVLTSEKKF